MQRERKKFIGHYMGGASRALQALFTNELKAQNLSFEQGIILLVISETPQIHISHIAKELKKNKATISREINSLIAKGLISAEVPKDDKRLKLFSLTPSGKDALNLIEDGINKIENLFSAQFSQQELDICLDVLSRMRLFIMEYMNLNLENTLDE